MVLWLTLFDQSEPVAHPYLAVGVPPARRGDGFVAGRDHVRSVAIEERHQREAARRSRGEREGAACSFKISTKQCTTTDKGALARTRFNTGGNNKLL